MTYNQTDDIIAERRGVDMKTEETIKNPFIAERRGSGRWWVRNTIPNAAVWAFGNYESESCAQKMADENYKIMLERESTGGGRHEHNHRQRV